MSRKYCFTLVFANPCSYRLSAHSFIVSPEPQVEGCDIDVHFTVVQRPLFFVHWAAVNFCTVIHSTRKFFLSFLLAHFSFIFCCLFHFWNGVSLCNASGCPGTLFTRMASNAPRSSCLWLLSAEIIGMHHHCLALNDFFIAIPLKDRKINPK